MVTAEIHRSSCRSSHTWKTRTVKNLFESMACALWITLKTRKTRLKEGCALPRTLCAPTRCQISIGFNKYGTIFEASPLRWATVGGWGASRAVQALAGAGREPCPGLRGRAPTVERPEAAGGTPGCAAQSRNQQAPQGREPPLGGADGPQGGPASPRSGRAPCSVGRETVARRHDPHASACAGFAQVRSTCASAKSRCEARAD